MFAASSLLLTILCSGSVQAKVSPFEMVRWQGTTPEVQLHSTWYRLVSIDGVKVDALLSHCRRRHGGKWDRRFCEDLVQVLEEMGHSPGAAVDLELRDLTTSKSVKLRQVPMTEENRRRIWRAKPRSRAAAGPRIERKHAQRSASKFRFLTTRYWKDSDPAGYLTAEQAAADLDELEWKLANEYSYLKWQGKAYQKYLDAIRSKLAERIGRSDYHIQLRKLVALFGDGHSRVSGVTKALPPGYLPLAVADDGERLVALRPDSTALLDEDRAYLTAIDGRPVADWLQAAGPLIARGSRQFQRVEAVRYLSFVGYLRLELGLPRSSEVTLTLSNGVDASNVTLPLAERPSFAQRSRAGKVRRLDSNIGYVPIPDMRIRGPELERLRESVIELLDCDGLIIDVRGNSGGNRAALLALFPLFMPAIGPPRVVNVGAYRMPPGTKPNSSGHLANRFLFPASSKRFSPAAKTSIRQLGFSPKWRLPRKEFSDWHYLVIDRPADSPRFAGKVVLLTDSHCFSATDIFAGAFADLPQVTVMGGPTGGGSGRVQEVELYHSRLSVKLSTMASFRAGGELYDGRGVQVDVLLQPTLADLLGTSDSVLEGARRHLSGTQ